MISRASPRILRYQARLRASPFLQPGQAAPRRPVDRVLDGLDASTLAPRLLLARPDRSPVRRLVHADAPPRRSLVSRHDRAPRALVQALRGYGPSRASLGAAIDQLHVRHAPPRASRTVWYQTVAGASSRAEVPVLGHEGRPRAGQRDQAVPGAPVVGHVRHQRVSRAQRGRVGEQRVPRAVQHVRPEVRVRDQAVSRASRHPPVPGQRSVVVVRDQRVSRASSHLLVERRAPRVHGVLIPLRHRFVVHGLKGQRYLHAVPPKREKGIARNIGQFVCIYMERGSISIFHSLQFDGRSIVLYGEEEEEEEGEEVLCALERNSRGIIFVRNGVTRSTESCFFEGSHCITFFFPSMRYCYNLERYLEHVCEE